MKDRIQAPLDVFNIDQLRGTHDLGYDQAGIRTKLVIDGDSITTVNEMHGAYVQQCMDEVKRLSDMAKTRRPGGTIRGRIPMPLYQMWRKQWEDGPKLHGVLWRAFLAVKIEDRDYSKFRVEGV